MTSAKFEDVALKLGDILVELFIEYLNINEEGMITVENPKDVADTIYRLVEAINELPFSAEKERTKLGETIVNLCKLLDVEL